MPIPIVLINAVKNIETNNRIQKLRSVQEMWQCKHLNTANLYIYIYYINGARHVSLYTGDIVTRAMFSLHANHFCQEFPERVCDLDQELPVIILITPFFTFTGTWCNVIINRAQAYPHTIHSNDSTNEYTCTWMATKWENIEFWFRQWRQTECSLKNHQTLADLIYNNSTVKSSTPLYRTYLTTKNSLITLKFLFNLAYKL